MMGKQIITKGDLFTYDDHYVNGQSYTIIAKLIYIKYKETGEEHNQLEVITGHGDLNTKVFLFLKPLCDSKLNDLKSDLVYKLDSNGLVKLDPHKTYLVDIDSEIKNIRTRIEYSNKKIKFLEDNRSLDYKLEVILSD